MKKKRLSPTPLVWVCFVFAISLAGGLFFSGCKKPPPKVKSITLGVVPKGTTSEFWAAIQAGAEMAAEELKVRIIWNGPLKEGDPNEQAQIVRTLVESRADALLLDPIDGHALAGPMEEARKRGIPMVIFNSYPEGGPSVACVSTDNYKGGVAAGDHVGTLLKGKGRLILVRKKEGIGDSAARTEGFLKTIRSRSPKVQILADGQFAGIDAEAAYLACKNLLNKFKRVDAVFAPSESATFGCLRALRERGLAGKVILVGFDTSKELIEALAKKEISGLVIQNPIHMGYESVRVAVAHLRGKPHEKNIDAGVFLATPDNMNEYKTKKLLSPDLSLLLKQ